MRGLFYSIVVLTFLLAGITRAENDVEKKVDAEPQARPRCDDDLPVMTVAVENLISTKAEWDAFVKKHPLFVLGVGDSACKMCCESEPVLNDLLSKTKGKNLLSYPVKDKKSKKIKRHEIPIARIDVANKAFIEKLKSMNILFGQQTMIFGVKNGEPYKWDAHMSQFEHLPYFLQKLANPIVSLSTEEEIMEFLENEPTSWKDDKSGGIVVKDKELETGNIDEFIGVIGYNTRVVAFWYGKDEWSEEINALKQAATRNAARMNLRVAQVTDPQLITRMQKSHPEMFNTMSGMSVMVLKRYDGHLAKLDLNISPAGNYNWWLNAKTSKPVDHLGKANFQMTELANLPMIIIFVDFNSLDEKTARESRELVTLMEEMAVGIDHMFKIYWTDEPQQLDQRRLLGITWDELPSMGVNTLEHVVFAYPKDQPFEKEHVDKWLRSAHYGRHFESNLEGDSHVSDFVKKQTDITIQDYFLDNTIYADRKIFQNEILVDEIDAVVMFYSSENINYLQRKACHQFNILAGLLKSEVYGNLVPSKLKFYAYDSNMHSFPKGIQFMSSPPEDIDGAKMHSKEQKAAGLPSIFIFPSENKTMPWTRFIGRPFAIDMLKWIDQLSNHELRLNMDDFNQLGKRTIDEENFQKQLDKEGVINLRQAEHDEL